MRDHPPNGALNLDSSDGKPRMRAPASGTPLDQGARDGDALASHSPDTHGPDDPAASDGETDDAPRIGHLEFRTIWISDTHLGTPGCRAQALLEFLRRTESQYLYLVGDIIDGWQLKRRWYWHQLHNDVIQKVLRKARKGTRVVYIPGNHDEAARHYVGQAFGGIEIREEAIHTTVRATRLLVTHGDFFDGVVRYARWLALLGDVMYSFALRLNRHLNTLRARLGMPYWSLSQYLKQRVKNAVRFIATFEQALAREARRRDFDGVVCGHIHHAEIRDIDGILYCNDGDWVESLTALVETADGELRILHWHEVLAATSGPKDRVAPAPGHTANQPEFAPDN